jgi:hypothetical protein
MIPLSCLRGSIGASERREAKLAEEAHQMKAAKIVVILLVVYAVVVAAFEALLGFVQPADQNTIVITTLNDEGTPSERVVSRIDHDGKLYVAANHWPRAWYNQALKHPDVEVTLNGEQAAYRATPATRSEHEAVDGAHPLGLGIRVLTGFPPRYFLRLDPQ